MIQERLAKLRELMKDRGINAYLVPTADFHESEYVGDYFKCRSFLSGFTGSAGTLAVTMDEAALWVDGRYFVQAGNQLQGSGISMMKMVFLNRKTTWWIMCRRADVLALTEGWSTALPEKNWNEDLLGKKPGLPVKKIWWI